MRIIRSTFIIALVLLVTVTGRAQEVFTAVVQGNLAKVKELIDKDTQLINARNARQSTPLHVAASLDNEEISKYLIEKGSDINSLNGNFYTPLMFAGIKVTKLLVEKGADVNYKSRYGWSALAEAFWRGKKDVAEYLLDNGIIIPDLKTTDGMNTIIAALRIGSVKYLEKFLHMGLDPMFESEAGNSLIHFAAESNSDELVNRLTELGVAVIKTNIYGWTPLHVAVANGNKSVAEMLIKKGLDKNARTTAGKSPYNLARETGVRDIIDYLASIGADTSPQKFPVLKGDYMGQPRPGKKAIPFAPGILSAQYNFHSSVAFTPDGNELFIKSMNPFILCGSKRINGTWTIPDTVKKIMAGDVPIISPDGSKLFFIAMQQVPGQPVKELIYTMDKTPTGWSDPNPLPDIINSVPGIHWQLSVDRKGNLYFGARQNGTVASRIYFSEYKNGSYNVPGIMDNLKDTDAHSPFIAPDGSYLIISANGLKILFRKSDGSWTKEKDITEIVGCEGLCPIVTHDGKYLFFLHNVGDKILPYWVDASFIEELRPVE